MPVVSALVNLGGDVRVLGAQHDGRRWRIGIQHPRAPAQVLAWIDVAAGAHATIALLYGSGGADHRVAQELPNLWIDRAGQACAQLLSLQADGGDPLLLPMPAGAFSRRIENPRSPSRHHRHPILCVRD